MHLRHSHRLAESIVLLLLIGIGTSQPTTLANISMIFSNQLKHILDDPQVVVIDVRTVEAWRKSPVKIKGV